MLRIVGILSCINHFTFQIPYAVTVGAPHLTAVVGGVDVGSHTAADIGLRLHLEYDFASAGISQVRAVAAVFVTLLFAFVQSFMPNRKVQLRASLEGGFLTAVIFCGWIRLCTAAQVGIGKSSAFYGSFASPMIVLAWIYMSWQIILLGANITHAFQCVHTRARDDLPS